MDAGNFPAGLRVLAVDDDRVSLMILEKQLNHCNYTVTTVTDGEKALHMLRERKDGDQFNLVISDVVMPGIDGFKLLELIGLEMDIPVIMLSANNETEIMMKGINHGACDYLVKPVRLEQLRGIWMHMVRNNKTDPRNSSSGGNNFADQKLQSEDGNKGDKNGANRIRKYSKNKKDVGGADEDKENTSTQKRQRVHWPGDLHRKFVQAVHQIGMDKAVPKKILEAMNVEGLSRENVASHLQKYRIYLRKLSEGKLKNPNPFVDGPKAWWSDWVPANISMTVPESFKHHLEVGRYQSVPSFVDSQSSSNLYARMNSPSAVETHSVLSIQSDQPMNSRSNLGIPRHDKDVMEPIGHSVTLGTVPMPPLQDVSKFMLSGWLSGASQCFPSGPSGSSFANISNGVVYNTSNPPSLGISGSSFANISNDSPPLATSMQFSSSRSCTSYASILRGKILGSSKGIPFEDIADGGMLAPSDDLPMQSPELVNQRSVQIQSSTDLFNQVAREAHQFPRLSDSWKADELSRFPDLDHDVRMSKCPSQGNIIKINQLSRLAASCGQVQIAGIMGRTTSMIGVSEQVPQFNFGSNTHYTAVPISDSNPGSSASTRPALPNLQLDNYVMATPIPNDGGASGNLPEDGTNQHAVGDQVTNSDEFLVGTSDPRNGASGDLDEIFSDDWFNDDFINSGDTFTDGDWEFAT